MSAAQPRPESATSAVSGGPAESRPAASHAPGSAPTLPFPQARLADELAIPAPSPVHQLQAELVQLTRTPEPAPEPSYPGWFRLGFPITVSVVMWAAILWGASRLG